MNSLRSILVKTALSSFVCLCAISFLGQNLKYTASSEMLASKSSHTMFSDFIGEDEQYVYVRTNKGFVNSRQNKIVIFEKQTMRQIAEYELDSKNDSRLLNCFAAKGIIYIFKFEKNDRESQITCEMFDPRFNAVGEKKVLEKSDKPNYFSGIKINSIATERILFALVNTIVDTETKKIALHVQFFDEQLSDIQDKTFELEASLDLSDVGHEYVQHIDKLLQDGTVTVNLIIRGSQQKFASMNYQSESYFYAYNPKEEELITTFEPKLPKSSKEYWPSDVLSDGTSTYLAGLYFEKEEAQGKIDLKNASGIFLSPLTSDIKGSKTVYLKLTPEFLQQLVSLNADGTESVPFSGINITYFKKDASGITLAFRCVEDFFYNNYYGNIGIVHANPQGEIEWNSKINTSSSSNSIGFPTEMMVMVDDQTMFLVYDKDIDSQTKKDRKKKLKKEGFILDYTTVDLNNGKTAQKELKIPLPGFELSNVTTYRDFQMDVCNNQMYIQSFDASDKKKKKGYYLHVFPE